MCHACLLDCYDSQFLYLFNFFFRFLKHILIFFSILHLLNIEKEQILKKNIVNFVKKIWKNIIIHVFLNDIKWCYPYSEKLCCRKTFRKQERRTCFKSKLGKQTIFFVQPCRKNWLKVSSVERTAPLMRVSLILGGSVQQRNYCVCPCSSQWPASIPWSPDPRAVDTSNSQTRLGKAHTGICKWF